MPNSVDMQIAVGTNDIVTLTGNVMDIYDKFGNHLSSQDLGPDFYSVRLSQISDPRILWDQYSSRFILVNTHNFVGGGTDINISVSKDANPGDYTSLGHPGWQTYTYHLPGSDNVNKLAIGLDQGNLYISGNYYNSANVYQNSPVWAVDRSALESGGSTPALPKYLVTDLSAPKNDLYTAAHMFGAPSGLANGDFLLNYVQNNAGNDTLNIIEVANASTGAPTHTLQQLNTGNISDAYPAGAPQPSTSTLAYTGDTHIQYSVWQDNRLYALTEIRVGAGANAHDVVHWFVVDTSNLGALSLLGQGDIDYGPNTATYYGNLAVDQAGNMIVGYSFSSTTQRINSMYMTVAPDGSHDAGVTFATGAGIILPSGTLTGVAIDPVDGNGFWVFNAVSNNQSTSVSTIAGHVVTADDFPDDRFTSGAVASGGSASGQIQFDGDRDWFKIDVTAGQHYVIDIHGNAGAGGLADPYVRLYSVQGRSVQVLAQDDDGGRGHDSQLAIQPSASGTLYVSVGSHGDSGQGSYTVSVGDPSPQFELAAFSSGAGGWSSQNHFPRQLGDVNGDGLADIVGFGDAGTYVAFANGGFNSPFLALAKFGSAAGSGGWDSQDHYPREVADVNGDGKADIVGFGDSGVFVSLATGGGAFAPAALQLASYAPGAGGWISDNLYPRQLADVNGDGRADIVGFGDSHVYVSLATAGGGFATPVATIAAFGPSTGGWSSQDAYPRLLGDVNGDGRADIVGFGDSHVYVALADGFGGFNTPVADIAGFTPSGGSWISDNLYPRQLADVNGDGMADIVGFGSNGVSVSLATGGGHFSQLFWNMASFGTSAAAGGWTSEDLYPREVAHITPDHPADIVGFGAAGVYTAQVHDYLIV